MDFAAYRDAFMLGSAASALKAGIVAADALSTVSPTYAREIQTRNRAMASSG
jgi:glycogen synthase